MSLNKGTELEGDPNELSLHERMLLITKSFQSVLGLSAVVVVVCLCLAVVIILGFQNPILQDIANDPENDVTHAISDVAIILAILCSLLLAWFAKSQIKNHTESERVIKEYTDQAYLVALSVSGRTKDEDISLDFFNIARDVFPEIKKADIKSVKETGEELGVEELTLEDKKKGDYTFDLVSEEISGDNKFLIKCFEKKVSYDDFEECCKIASKEWGKDHIFRLVCMAENFDSKILKSYEEIREIGEFPVDLILYNEKGFGILKISEKSV